MLLTSPGTSVPTEDGNPFPTRRELRAREAAAAAGSKPEAGSEPDAVSNAAEAIAEKPSTTDLAVEMVVTRASSVRRSPSQPKRSAPVAAPAPRRAKGKNPAMVLISLVAIPGIFLTAALPAYAFSPNGEVAGGASASHSLTQSGAQALTVDAASPALTVARDSFTATTREELDAREREAQRVAAAQAAIAAAALRSSLTSSSSSSDYAVYGPRAEGDDYPWPYARTDENGGGLSPLGYYFRECVDFVAWRLNRDAGSTGSPFAWTWGNLTPGGGNASSWKSQWERHGWATSDEPVVGAVAWFTYNHVAYVQSIPGDGTVVLEEYNWMHSHAYHTRTIPIGQVAKFLYPPS